MEHEILRTNKAANIMKAEQARISQICGSIFHQGFRIEIKRNKRKMLNQETKEIREKDYRRG